MTFRRGLLVVLAAGGLSAGVSGSALADQPRSAPFADSFTGVFWSCPGFDVIESVTLDGQDTVHFDRDGHAVRHVVRLAMRSTLTRSDTGEVLGAGRAAVTTEENLSNDEATNEGPRAGTYRLLGLDLQIKIGNRTVARQVGQIYIDIRDHDDPFDDEVRLRVGRHDLDEGFDICAALA